MKASEVMAKVPGATCSVSGNDGDVNAAFTSDLLSDVMGNAPEESVLITIQAHMTTVAVAANADIRAILVCSGRAIPDDMAAAAEKQGIAVWRTPLDQFHASVAVARALGTEG